MKYAMLYSSTLFCEILFFDANVCVSGSKKIACIARKTAGVPCASEIRQLAASGLVFGLHLRKTMKCADKYIVKNIVKKSGVLSILG